MDGRCGCFWHALGRRIGQLETLRNQPGIGRWQAISRSAPTNSRNAEQKIGRNDSGKPEEVFRFGISTSDERKEEPPSGFSEKGAEDLNLISSD